MEIKNKIKQINYRVLVVFVKDGNYFVIGAVLPSGQNILKQLRKKKSLFLCFFDRIRTKT